MIDVTMENFEADVIAASQTTPVLVDFWADWCAAWCADWLPANWFEKPAVSSKPHQRFMICTAWPLAPFTMLSSALITMSRPVRASSRHASSRTFVPTTFFVSGSALRTSRATSMPLISGKTITGSTLGGIKGRSELPDLVDWYVEGKINLDDLISHRLTLDQINEGYEAMRQGQNIRGVIVND